MTKKPLRLVPPPAVFSIEDAQQVLASFPPARPEPDDPLRKVEAIEALTYLVEEYGAARVQSWLRNIAANRGESL